MSNKFVGCPAPPDTRAETTALAMAMMRAAYDMSGISLRDWFAGQALQMFDYAPNPDMHLARKAYDLADAMMAAREPKP